MIDLDGRTLRLTANSGGVARAGETLFTFRQSGSVFWGSYTGGHIVRGVLLGQHEDGTHGAAHFRFQQIDAAGVYRAGAATTRIERDARGRIVMHDRWHYTAGGEGSGEAVLEEITGAEGV